MPVYRLEMCPKDMGANVYSFSAEKAIVVHHLTILNSSIVPNAPQLCIRQEKNQVIKWMIFTLNGERECVTYHWSKLNISVKVFY